MLTDTQRAQRKKGIGGSDAAAICGLVKWKTPYQVFQEKLCETPNNEAENSHMRWGNLLEPQIAEEYSRQTGNKVEIVKDTIFSKNHHFMLANIDRNIKNANAILECKVASSHVKHQWGEPGTDEIPTPYLLQCAHYAVVCDVEYVDIAVLIDMYDFRIYRYVRNEKLEGNLIRKEKNFWENYVLTGTAPPPINIEDASRVWNKANQGEAVLANEEIKKHVDNLNKLKEQIRILETQKIYEEFNIKSYMRTAEKLTDEFGHLLISWRNRATSRLNTQELKNKHPDIYSELLRQANQRTFLIHGEI